MTHDELLASVSPDGFRKNNNALRAVIELHNTKDMYFPKYVWGQDGLVDTGGTHRAVCECGYLQYPCATIQAIEKELG